MGPARLDLLDPRALPDLRVSKVRKAVGEQPDRLVRWVEQDIRDKLDQVVQVDTLDSEVEPDSPERPDKLVQLVNLDLKVNRVRPDLWDPAVQPVSRVSRDRREQLETLVQPDPKLAPQGLRERPEHRGGQEALERLEDLARKEVRELRVPRALLGQVVALELLGKLDHPECRDHRVTVVQPVQPVLWDHPDHPVRPVQL